MTPNNSAFAIILSLLMLCPVAANAADGCNPEQTDLKKFKKNLRKIEKQIPRLEAKLPKAQKRMQRLEERMNRFSARVDERINACNEAYTQLVELCDPDQTVLPKKCRRLPDFQSKCEKKRYRLLEALDKKYMRFRKAEEVYVRLQEGLQALQNEIAEAPAKLQRLEEVLASCLEGRSADLVVTDIYFQAPHIFVNYENIGNGLSRGDFLIKLSSAHGEYPGNHYYRFEVPAPGENTRTGGFTPLMIGMESGMVAMVTAEIDWEERVKESNENNNLMEREITHP